MKTNGNLDTFVKVVRLIEQIFKIFDDLTDFLAIYKVGDYAWSSYLL